ncbi:hypothetical protein PACTADRAFT_51929 [Pachysolen tannophilus NRRL Y-2460]|uniref:Conserved oligomeric Golgi complex subunit 3 C-terminal domain-containing protein n=1 Tax=Pachysolen tannophilus NRRL Y-2460 TaxID=669874 RepID=A0A1E4TNL4_PACTA|nr:hypothetical protein PACTADRAFT_51929 [Pachysolen tannophilus NRRL Y-2460]
MKFRQCMVRALTLIRNYVVEGFKKISNELNSKLKVGMISNVTIEALIYNRFQEDCSKFKPLINELYIRTIIIEEDDESNYDSEYLGLLTDCYNNYFKIRKHFLSSYIHNHLSNYNSTNKVLIHYIQDNISFFSNICNKELKIFKSIFYSSPNLNKYNNKVINNEFQDILNPLYQLARTKILRETSIDRLCDVITLLQKYYEFEYDEGNSEIESVGIGNNENSLDLKFASDDSALNKTIRFDKLFEPILKEVQTKLILRIQVYIDKNILNYKPSGEELTIANRRIKQKQKSENSNADDASFNDTASSIVTTTSMIDENINKTLKEFNIDQDETSSSLYYPPILKSIKLLNKIYQLVDPKIFSDLANSIVHLLILSIRETFEKNYVINNKNKTDLKLYLIKNYIFLKKVLDTNFDIEYVGNESILDFSGLQGLIYGVINKTETTLNDKYRRKSSIGSENGFFNKVLKSVPKYVNNIIDGKQELTVELRNLIHSYIDDCSDIILLPLKSITKDNIQNANEILGDFKKNLNIEIERRKTQILNYIDDDETVVSSLIDGIKESIVNKYENVYQYINELFTKNGVKDTELMEADTLLYFLNN